MNYFQDVMVEFLRAERTVFVNTECLIQLDLGDKPPKGRHWYCDAVAINFEKKTAYLCEITYSSTLQSLLTRLAAWETNWQLLCDSVKRDCSVPLDWKIQPWVFVPQKCKSLLEKKLPMIKSADGQKYMPTPKIEVIEEIMPWLYRTWDKKGDEAEA